MDPEEELELLELEAEANRRKVELDDTTVFDTEEVGDAALEGAVAGAAFLPAITAWGRYRNLGATAEDPAVIAGSKRGSQAAPVPEGRYSLRGGTPKGKAARIFAGVLDDAARFAIRNPKSFVAAELAAGAGAGAAANVADQGGMGPTGQAGASVTGGLLGGLAPVGLYNATRRLVRWGMDNIAPFISSGAHYRAAKELQRGVADPAAAAELAANAPFGMTPARATQDPYLMDIEASVARENPAWAKEVEDDLLKAINTATGELSGLYGTPRGRADWERAVFQRVAAPGTDIPHGTTDEMLTAAYNSFDDMYAPAKGWDVKLRMNLPNKKTRLDTMLANVSKSATTTAGEDTRKQVDRWLKNKYSGLLRRAKDDVVKSEDLMDFRSRIRTRIRERTGKNDDEVELLELAEDRVTTVLEHQLSKEARAALRAADRQYGALKTVSKAVAAGGESALTPEKLLIQLRKGGGDAYARGSDPYGLRTLGNSGRSINSVLSKPEDARQLARGLDAEGARNAKAGLVGTLMDQARHEGSIQGVALQRLIREQTPVAKALGMSDEEIGRIDRIAEDIRRMQTISPAGKRALIEDGPTNALQLLATIIGVKQGKHVSSAVGGGGSLALTAFFTKRMRNILATVTASKAEKLLIEAQGDRELYAALLTRPTDPIKKQVESARILNGWLGNTAVTAVDEELEELRQTAKEFE